MNLNSRLFDRIRTRPEAEQVLSRDIPRCDYPGCRAPGGNRAPKGRNREGEYFSFCLGHVREYNASYNYFAGMSDEAVARYQKEAIVGHRPTWTMGGQKSAKSGDPQHVSDPLGLFSGRVLHHHVEPAVPRYNARVMKALAALHLDETADGAAIKARYKEMVKRLHPDANGGDRSNEDRLREIIQAYNALKSAKLA
jgi:hypothetical protein